MSSDSNANINAASLKKGRWSTKDDALLDALVKAEPSKPRWTSIAKKFGSRSGKQCRERWENHLRLGIKKRRFTSLESQLIHDEVEKYRPEHPRWAAIAAKLECCTPLMVRNHVNNIRRKKHQSVIKKRKAIKNKTANLSVKELRPKKVPEEDDDSSTNKMSVSYLTN